MVGVKSALDFTYRERAVPTPHETLKPHEFDVRDEAGTDPAAVTELERQLETNDGKHKRNPVRTLDNVVVEGRHAVAADFSYQTKKGILNPVTLMDVLPFKWSDLRMREQAEVRLWALRQNMDNKGFHRIATFNDKVLVVKDCLRVKPPMEDELIHDNLPGTTLAEVRKLIKVAHDSLVQEKLANARRLLQENPKLTSEQALRASGLTLHHMKNLIPGTKKREKPFAEHKRRQIRDQKIFVIRLKQQAEQNRKLFEAGMPAIQYRELLTIQKGSLQKAVREMAEIEQRAEELIAKKTPKFHLI